MLLRWSIMAAVIGFAVCQKAPKGQAKPQNDDVLPDETGARLFNWFIKNKNLFEQTGDGLKDMKDYVYGKRLEFVGKPHAFDFEITLPVFKQMITYLANKELDPKNKYDQILLKKKEKEVKKKLMSYLAMAFITSNNLPQNAANFIADVPVAEWQNATAPPKKKP